MLFSVGITQPRSLMELVGWKRSKTTLIGLVHGLLKDKACFMGVKQCRNQAKTLHTQLLLTPVHLNYPFLLTSLTKYKPSGKKLYQPLTAPLIKPSAILVRAATQLLQRSNPLDSRCLTTSLKLTPLNIYIKQTKTNATSSFTNVGYQARTRTCSWSVMLSWDISTQYMTLIVIRFHSELTFTLKAKFRCINLVSDQEMQLKHSKVKKMLCQRKKQLMILSS